MESTETGKMESADGSRLLLDCGIVKTEENESENLAPQGDNATNAFSFGFGNQQQAKIPSGSKSNFDFSASAPKANFSFL